jgi:hypothetical protein
MVTPLRAGRGDCRSQALSKHSGRLCVEPEAAEGLLGELLGPGVFSVGMVMGSVHPPCDASLGMRHCLGSLSQADVIS